jgi:phytoene dehydrogenase-like protein
LYIYQFLGHNGLVSAAYLQKAGYSVCVLERRHIVGGGAVTEEIIPGFKFSRASYLLSLLRPYIISDLKLKVIFQIFNNKVHLSKLFKQVLKPVLYLQKHGLKLHMREPYNSYTPIHEFHWSNFSAKALLLSSSPELNRKEISKFSEKDAVAFDKYEEKMTKFVKALNHLVDHRPPNLGNNKGLFSFRRLKELKPALKALQAVGLHLPEFHELLTGSAGKILDKWFESEPLKATLATDALIGTMSGPNTPGTG